MNWRKAHKRARRARELDQVRGTAYLMLFPTSPRWAKKRFFDIIDWSRVEFDHVVRLSEADHAWIESFVVAALSGELTGHEIKPAESTVA